jgi:hypothetical protein
MSTRLLPESATAIALVERPLLLHPVKQANAANTARTTIAMATRCEILFFPSENRIVSSLALNFFLILTVSGIVHGFYKLTHDRSFIPLNGQCPKYRAGIVS